MPIDPLPSISRSDSNFRTQVDDYFLTRLPAFSTQAESARVQIVAAESTTTSAASTATTAATTATTAAGTATSASSSAVTAKNAAEAAAANAISTPVAAPIHAATAKTTPADADELGLSDSAASWGLKKLTFANLKTWIGSLFVSKSGDTIGGNLNVTGNVLVTGGGGLVYGVGSGGTTTQTISNTETVALNKPSGQITMSGPMAAGETAIFRVNNSYATSQSVIALTLGAGMVAAYSVEAEAQYGFFRLYVRNVLGAATSVPALINFAVIGGSAT